LTACRILEALERCDAEFASRWVLAVWQPWAKLQVTGRGIDCGHHVAEEAPEDLAEALTAFFLPDCRQEEC
jgi:hypothetical protein